MICPHCSANLLFRERSGRRCSKCRREFALEPKQSPLRMHDRRLLHLDAKLSVDGRLWYAPEQLYYAAAVNRLRTRRPALLTLLIYPPVVLLLAIVLGGGTDPQLVAAALAMAAVAALAQVLLAARWAGRVTVRPAGDPNLFLSEIRRRWQHVYRSPPARLLHATMPPAAPVPAGPVDLVVLCPSAPVAASLIANGVTDPVRFGATVTVVGAVERVPPDAPVLVLHDASGPGFLFAANAFAVLGNRARAGGPRPRRPVPGRAGLVLREPRLSPEKVDALRSCGLLRPDELDTVAEGWWFPLAAVPPQALLSRVQAALTGFGVGEPDRRRAATVGFMTWPGR